MGEVVYSTCEKCGDPANVWWVSHVSRQRFGRWFCGTCLAFLLEQCLNLAEVMEERFYESN